MISRVSVVFLGLISLLTILYISPRAQQATCSSPGLGYICSALNAPAKWDLFYHLGGNGPWIARAPESSFTDLPPKCEVEQVHMISRHAERYPTVTAGARHIALLSRLQAADVHLSGSLAFLKGWHYFTNLSNPDFEDLITHGPYAGTLQAANTGRKLREQYANLVDSNKTTTFWSCSSPRDIETAKYFANGFFGEDWERSSATKLEVIPETAERGADTLTPGDTCLKYIEDKVYGHDRGYGELAKWQDTFAPAIAARLKHDAGGLYLSPLEVYGMMEICGFEILVRGSSQWCDVFTHEDWLDFEYGRDLLHFYRAGPGNDFAGAMGWLWLSATTKLISNATVRGVYLSFVHDGDIVPLLATLGILEEPAGAGYLPNNMRKDKRKWRTSDLVPMGGRLILEKVTCSNTGLGGNLRRSYVRLFINDGIINLEKSLLGGGLANGAGMAQWTDMVRKKRELFGNFKEVCGLPNDAPDHITFLQPQYQL